jgi:hypothetical protein
MTELEQVKKAFKDGKKMANVDALKSFGTNRLASYVRTLRKDGMNIVSEGKCGTYYYVYWLDKGK